MASLMALVTNVIRMLSLESSTRFPATAAAMLLLLTYIHCGLADFVKYTCTQDELHDGFDLAYHCNPDLNQISTRILALTSEDYGQVCGDLQAYVDCMEKSLVCIEVMKEFQPSLDIYTGDPFYCLLSNNTYLPEYLDPPPFKYTEIYTSTAARGLTASPVVLSLTVLVVISTYLSRFWRYYSLKHAS